jgi:hypothetical protein
MDQAFINTCLAVGPVGHWVTARGSFDVVARDQIWFLPDGRGHIAGHSALFGDSRFNFLWRVPMRGWLEVCGLPDSGDVAADEPWARIKMEFAEHTTDTGTDLTLREGGTDGFWIIPSPLRWEGPSPAPVGLMAQR